MIVQSGIAKQCAFDDESIKFGSEVEGWILIRSGYWGTADFTETGRKFKMAAATILNLIFGP